MRYYKIEIDEEVHQYLVSKIQDFSDTENSILRKELLKTENKEPALTADSYQLPEIPAGMPIALQHILEVVYLVKKRGLSRSEATISVAKRHHVSRETVLDKYGRQLNKSTREVDDLLEDHNLSNFELILNRKFPIHSTFIESFFNQIKPNPEGGQRNFKIISEVDELNSTEFITLERLYNLGTKLGKKKPKILLINDKEYRIQAWTEFDVTLIKWLLENKLMSRSDLPINATKDKYFINSIRSHKNPICDGNWVEIEAGIFFDSKFNAFNHIRNAMNLLKQLHVQDQCIVKMKIM
ncbi:MAG: hypothetical protein WD267_06490 [Balneolales bacterium]